MRSLRAGIASSFVLFVLVGCGTSDSGGSGSPGSTGGTSSSTGGAPLGGTGGVVVGATGGTGNFSNGGTGIAVGAGGVPSTGGAMARGAGGVDGGAPSCRGLAATCGPSGNEDCCSSSVIPGGTFFRSYDGFTTFPKDYTSEAYPATVSAFRLDDYEVTVGRFRRFVAAYSRNMTPAAAGRNPSDPGDPGWDSAWNTSMPADAAALTSAARCTYPTWTESPGANENKPMNCITWYESLAFCVWDNGRLPTEAEWNYAAAGGSEQRVYPWGVTVPGADANLAVYGCYYDVAPTCGVNSIAPVGSVSAGNGKWGPADLAGNVREWTLDWYTNPYSPGACDDCANTTPASFRVIRGGSFWGLASFLFSSYRSSNDPADHNVVIGSRCAR